MSNYVVSDTNLTSVANAIRAKGGTSADLAFPAGFVSAVEAIPTGGGENYIEKLISDSLDSYANESVQTVRTYAFASAENLVEIELPNVTTIGDSAFNASGITSFKCNKDVSIGRECFRNCQNLRNLVFRQNVTPLVYNSFSDCPNLEIADFGAITSISTGMFIRNTAFTKLIIRNGLSTLSNLNALNSTTFASSGTGGTLYVPSALIDSYKTATNWSTILGYENNQILPIEGSIYETQYADGTAIE